VPSFGGGRQGLRLAANDAMWSAMSSGRPFVSARLTKAQGRNLAVTLFCLLEGAFILARATRDDTPVRTAGRAAADAVGPAFDKRSAQKGARRRGE
jgi:hypothetical protein